MIFNDIVKAFESIEYILKELKKPYETAKRISEAPVNMMTPILLKSYVANNSNYYNDIYNSNNKQIEVLMNLVKNEDLFTLGAVSNQIDSAFPNFINSLVINKLKMSLSTYGYSMNNFIRALRNDGFSVAFTKLINSANEFVSSYEYCISLFNELLCYKEQLETNWGSPTDDKNSFTLRIYRESLTLSEMTLYNESVEKMYSILCRSLEVTETEYPLLPVKLESGSWYAKLKGNATVITLLINLLGFVYQIHSENFSQIADTRNQVEQANLIKSKLEVVKLADDIGIKLTDSGKKSLEEELTAFLQASLTLTKQNTEIELNGSTIELVDRDELRKYLMSSPRQALSEPPQK